MADKMMRIAGRGNDGTAKAVGLTNDNYLKTDSIRRVKLVEGMVPLNSNDTVNTNIVSVAEGNLSGSNGLLNINLDHPRQIEVTIVYQTKKPNGSLNTEEEELLFVGQEEQANYRIPYDIKTPTFFFKIKNISTLSTNIHLATHTLITQNEFVGKRIDELLKNNIVKRKLITDRGFVNVWESNGEVFESDMLEAPNHTTGRLNVLVGQKPREIKITKINYHREGDLWKSRSEEVIFHDLISTDDDNMISIEYPINSERYVFRIENFSQQQASLHFVEEILYNAPIASKEVNEGLNEGLNDIKKAIEAIEAPTIKTKNPTSTLKFEKAKIPKINVFTRIDNEKSLVVSTDYTFHIYKNITSDSPELLESGYTWDTPSLGRLVNVRTTLDGGIVVFADEYSTNSNQVRIYKMADINSEPVLKYESNTGVEHESSFATYDPFGIKSYDNGLKTLVLAGVYGRGGAEQDLLLSTDNGETFRVIKKTAGNKGDNSHWHDVAFDVHSGYIWASEGDNATSRNVWWSDNLGETWSAIKPEFTTQPTAIIPFPDKVILGRDSNYPGIDIVRKVPSSETYSFETHFEFKKDTLAYKYYAQSPIVDGAEAYMSFSIFADHEPKLLIGSGDFGESWHFVFMGSGPTEDEGYIRSFVDMDDDYVYALMASRGSGTTLLYAKRVKWQ